jgi:glycosyltransferase involved in cell wall biosynthesis
VKDIYNKVLILPIVRWIEKYNILNASMIVVVSKALESFLINLGARPEKIIVIPNAVDETKYHPDIDANKIKDQYHLHDKVVLGFIGTFGEWHGAENIVLAYGKLLEDHPEFKNNTVLFMIGDGVRMGEVIKYINHLGISENVVLTGLVPQKEGARYMAACDILINATLPNPDGSEFFGSPTKLFEYMALGKAIICSNMAQMAEIIEHNVTGFLVEPGSIPSLSSAMEVLINNAGLRERLGKNARNKVLSKHTWAHNIDSILAHLGDLTGEPFLFNKD